MPNDVLVAFCHFHAAFPLLSFEKPLWVGKRTSTRLHVQVLRQRPMRARSPAALPRLELGGGERRRRKERNEIKTEVFRGSSSTELKHRRPVLYNSTPSVRQTDAFRSYPLSWIPLSSRPTAPQPAASSGTQEVTETGNMTF